VTLSKPDLSALVRAQVEQQLDIALKRQQEIDVSLELLASGVKHVEEVLDPKAVIQRLRRLEKVLADGNASDINLELAMHIDAIFVHPDGKVVMRSNRLGIFEGVTELLAGNNSDDGPLDDPGDERNGFQIRPRALSRRRTTGPAESSKLVKVDGMIEGHVKLPEKWVDETVFHMPKLTSWAEDHAEEVFQRRQEAKLSYAKLASEFGVTPPTARAAVQHYLASHPEAKDEVNLPRGGKRPPKFDLSEFGHEARNLWEAGWSKLKLADKYGCSSPTVDKALAWSYAQDGQKMPAEQNRREAKIRQARSMLDDGQSLEDIAKSLDVSDVTARQYLKESFAAEGQPMPDLRKRRS